MSIAKPVKGVKVLKSIKACAVVSFLVVAAACGGSSGAPNDEGTGAATAAGGATSPAKVVPHETLQAFLPNLPGWTRDEPRGETDLSESVSRVQVNYDQKDAGGLSIEIMDTSGNQAMLEPMMAMVKPGYSENRLGTTTKARTVAGFPAYEEWTAEARNGAISVLVEGRFTVAVTGSFVADVATLQKVVEAIDLRKLAALSK